jgi:predicted HTH domain antitoxin
MSDITASTSEVMEEIGARLLQEAEARPSPVLLDLVKRGVEQKLLELYEEFQRGECSLGYLAEQLGISPWEAVHLLEERGLRTTNL